MQTKMSSNIYSNSWKPKKIRRKAPRRVCSLPLSNASKVCRLTQLWSLWTKKAKARCCSQSPARRQDFSCRSPRPEIYHQPPNRNIVCLHRMQPNPRSRSSPQSKSKFKAQPARSQILISQKNALTVSLSLEISKEAKLQCHWRTPQSITPIGIRVWQGSTKPNKTSNPRSTATPLLPNNACSSNLLKSITSTHSSASQTSKFRSKLRL